MRRVALCCLMFPLLIFAAKKEQNWKTGKVVADSTIGSSAGVAGPHHGFVDPHSLTIRGDDTIYTVLEKDPWTGWCLLIQGDEIKYAPDNRRLYVEDADGQMCKLDILTQEKLPSP
jgi:hypothetical protein